MQSHLKELDPTGERVAMFDYRRSPKSVKPGDILRVTFKNGDPFSGVCLNIRLRGVDTGILLRNHLTKVGVEMWVKVMSPNVESVEVVQRNVIKRKRRARMYYMRYVKEPKRAFACSFSLFSSRTDRLISAIENPSTILEVWRRLSPTTFGRSLHSREDMHREAAMLRGGDLIVFLV